MSLTLAEARNNLLPYIGVTLEAEQMTSRINAVRERFFNSGKWKGMVAQYEFATPGSQITLPRNLLSVLAAQFDDVPRLSYPKWHEFIASGPGKISEGFGLQMLVDIGDGFVTYLDPTSPFKLRVKVENSNDAGKTLWVSGLDSDGREVYSPDGNKGNSIQLASPSVTTEQVFTSVTAVRKDITEGYITLWAVDPDTDAETQIATYEPSEKKISYRRYKVTGTATQNSVNCLCKLRYVPLVHCIDDEVEVTPGNEGALKLGLISLQYEDKNDLERADEYMARAISLLNAELKEESGSPMVRFQFDPYGSNMQIKHMF